jgi:hypothetical protein
MVESEFIELDNSNVTPIEQLHMKEFVEGALKAGSFISMLENKKINTTTLFTLLLEKELYQEFFTEITASKSFKHAILSLLYLHPSLVKSKITKSVIRKLKPKAIQIAPVIINAKPTNRTRKTPIQQASSRIAKHKK